MVKEEDGAAGSRVQPPRPTLHLHHGPCKGVNPLVHEIRSIAGCVNVKEEPRALGGAGAAHIKDIDATGADVESLADVSA